MKTGLYFWANLTVEKPIWQQLLGMLVLTWWTGNSY